jgi:hypothetical protein
MILRRTRSISRRAFVRGIMAIPVAGAAALVIRSALGPGRPVTPARRLASIVSHRESAASVGREVLRLRPAEADASALLAALAASVPDLPRLLAEGSDDELRVAVDGASRRDFAEAGDGLIRINGWIASLTEARVCAIVAVA